MIAPPARDPSLSSSSSEAVAAWPPPPPLASVSPWPQRQPRRSRRSPPRASGHRTSSSWLTPLPCNALTPPGSLARPQKRGLPLLQLQSLQPSSPPRPPGCRTACRWSRESGAASWWTLPPRRWTPSSASRGCRCKRRKKRRRAGTAARRLPLPPPPRLPLPLLGWGRCGGSTPWLRP